MDVTEIRELKLSRLMLGTAQFGLQYGLANRTGQPSQEETNRIMACALDGGVNCLDTAANYGTSEEVVGRALAELGIADRITVVTKVPRMAQEFSSETAADEFVEQSVVRSLKRLRLDVLPVCLFHVEDNFRYIDSLLKVKEKGLVRRVGISVASPDKAMSIVSSGLVEAMQMPSSVLDSRFIRAGVPEEAKRRGVAIFIRSIYLQGLVLMPEADIPAELGEVVPVRRRLEALAGESGMTPAELAARYILSVDGVTSAVVGSETIEQMQQNIELFGKGSLDPTLVAAIREAVPELPDNLLTPSTWSMRMPDAVPVKG